MIKVLPEDFVVEELPEELPTGEGEHLYLWVEKRGRDTSEVAAELAKAYGVSARDVGYAGLKDRQAVTRQWFSVVVPGAESVPVPMEIAGARVLEAKRHLRKLRRGALRGNRFWITLRGTSEVAAVRPYLDQLTVFGVPNWFGPQRFGRHGDNALLGAALIGVGQHAGVARANRDPFLRKLALSALQSELFNRLLAERVRQSRLGALEVGDLVAVPEDSRAVLARDEALAPRVAAFEAAVTGPLFGARTPTGQGEPAAREQRALADAGLAVELLARGGQDLRGGRRPYRFRLGAVELRSVDQGLVLAFDLPAGSYATSVLRELTRSPEDALGASDTESD